MWIFSCFATFVLAFAPLTLQQTADPLVDTTLGRIQGSVMKTQKGADIFAFRGIYYAEPPLGKLRFAAPVPVVPWTGTLLATSNSRVCPQPGVKVLMTEDCLTLNVYSRNLTGTAPVLVYIHGGANVVGSGHSLYEAGPQYLLDQDVVLVAFNYRLGALGFLSTASTEAPGNFGYLDQVLALKWVQQHITRFGGDRELVTIFGLSAGSMAVTLHMASPLSQGLFHRAIAMSGAATNHYAIDNQYWTRKLAREMSCPMYNPQDVVDCLRAASWKDIINVCTNWEPYKFMNMKWNYEIDGNFLLEHPSEAFRTRRINIVPLMIGTTKDEFDFSVYHQENNTGLLNDISLNFGLYAPELFLYRPAGDGGADEWHANVIKSFYLTKPPNITSKNLQEFGEMFSDSLIGHGVHRLVQLFNRYAQVFYYRMDYVGQRSLYMDKTNKPRGVGHGDDLQYVMPGLWYGTQLSDDSPDMFMVERMTKWFATFARYGIPMSDDGEPWQPCAAGSVVTLYNDKNTYMDKEPYQERYELWDDMFALSESDGQRAQWSALCLVLLSALHKLL